MITPFRLIRVDFLFIVVFAIDRVLIRSVARFALLGPSNESKAPDFCTVCMSQFVNDDHGLAGHSTSRSA